MLAAMDETILASESRLRTDFIEFINANILPQFENLVTKDDLDHAMRRVDVKFDLLTGALAESDVLSRKQARVLEAYRIVH
ncbi:MAG: hypothetical protein HW383_7 [Candidatus Magasanikbacteria bacterium]|nr:hypothetical protein [Candidatus Magasanikbacteria bacterium]